MWPVALTVFMACALAGAESAGPRVPVLMWGAPAPTGAGSGPKALQSTTADHWKSTASLETKAHHLTVVFVEETLSPEDLSGKDSSSGRSSFEGLHRRSLAGNLNHIPAVETPLEALRDLAEPEDLNRVRLTDEGLSADIHSASGKFLFIELEDAKEGEDRFRMLARHDAFMNQMFDKLLEKHPSVLAIYTARYPSWEMARERVRRQAAETPALSVAGFLNVDDILYFYAPSVKFKSGDVEKNMTFAEKPTVTNGTDGVTFTMADGADTMTFNVTNMQGYWSIDSFIVSIGGADGEVMPVRDMYAPLGFSYSCRQVLSVTNTSKLELNSFQLQFFASLPEGSVKAEPRFDSSYDCVGTMSVPIWCGLFIVFLLLIITIGGVMMMMDIRTMDRFDDPKGKTITINASE